MTEHDQCLPTEDQDLARFVDVALAGYALLRLSPSGWRIVARKMMAPLSRLHALRNTRTRMWRSAINRLDCLEGQGGCIE